MNSTIKNKCNHKWETIDSEETIDWCERCGSIRDRVTLYMSGKVSHTQRSPKLYADVLRGVLKYG